MQQFLTILRGATPMTIKQAVGLLKAAGRPNVVILDDDDFDNLALLTWIDVQVTETERSAVICGTKFVCYRRASGSVDLR